MDKFLDQLGRRILFFDGAMGTMLQARGLGSGELPELWNLTRPEVVVDIHRQYVEAGCDILKTNTFGGNAMKLRETGRTVEEVATAAVKNAREGARLAGREAYVAMDIGPSGKLMAPLGDLGFEQAYELFAGMAAAGERAGADLILIETMSDTYEVKAAALAAKENTSLPVIVTLAFDQRGKLLTGGDIPAAAALLEGLRVDALGFNCGLGPKQVKELYAGLRGCCSLPVAINPNAGMPRVDGGRTVFDVGPQEFAEDMEELQAMGAWMLGGCCGTSPAHIAALVERCRDRKPLPLPQCTDTVVSSYGRAVSFSNGPVIIGERINPTGKKLLKQALRDRDMDYILREGIAQQENGAHILDVNAGLPEIDEAAMMGELVTALQSVTDLPLQIDTADPAALERGMRLYNGKPMVNSVNGKESSMEAVFPLVRRYGGVVVALTLDEGGIPESAQGRLEIARRIVERAAEYGIARKDIVVDPLCMAVSSDGNSARTTLEAVRLIKKELGVRTSLGVSNVSFGLPQREALNATFFSLALSAGLDGAILNPGSRAMMGIYDTYRALMGLDTRCEDYIARYGGQAAPQPSAQPAGGEMDLQAAIIKGLQERAYAAAKEMLAGMEPLEIIDGSLIPALDVVGKGYEAGTLFLPQLLMSAEAAKAAFTAISEHLAAKGEVQAKKGRMILATVQGDIHDIGKNIVKALLQNYGYDVIDLGKDVPVQTVVDAAVREDIRLVGLSALMTTTVASMEATIKALHAALPGCRVMVGGAVLNREYAGMIGADRYVSDAMASVHYAQEVFGA